MRGNYMPELFLDSSSIRSALKCLRLKSWLPDMVDEHRFWCRSLNRHNGTKRVNRTLMTRLSDAANSHCDWLPFAHILSFPKNVLLLSICTKFK